MFTKKTQLSFLESLYAIYFNSAGDFEGKKENIQDAVTSTEALKVWRLFDSDQDVIGGLSMVRKGRNIELKPFGVHIKKMMEAHHDEFGPSVITAALKFALYFRTGSEGAVRTIRKLSGSSVFPQWVRGGFSEKTIDQSSVATELKVFVKSVTGKPGLTLNKDQAEELREEDRPKYREYLQLRKSFANSWKNESANFIRSSGKEQVSMSELISHLDEQEMEYSIVPGFTGLVGIGPSGDLEWFSEDGRRIVGVPSPTFFSRVEMNEDRKDGGYVFTAIPATESSKPKYFYLAEELRKRRDEKFQMIRDVSPLIKHVREVWTQGIKHFDLDDDKTVAALLLELSYEFASRIGTEGNSTKGVSTFGLSTVLVRHIKLMPSGFTLTYPGKDGVKTSHKYKVKDAVSRMVLEAVKDLVEGKEPGDPIFTVGSDKPKPIRPAVVNSVFRRLVGHSKIGVHKMRTLRGTVLFSELADDFINKSRGKSLTQGQVETALKEMAAKVGQVLNHVRTSADGEAKVTGETALNAYIDPGAQSRIFDSLGLQYPKSLLKRLGKSRLDSSALVLAADEEVTDEELDTLEEDTQSDAPDGEEQDVLPADEDEPSEEPTDEEPTDEEPTEEEPVEEEPGKTDSEDVLPADEDEASDDEAEEPTEEKEEKPKKKPKEKEKPKEDTTMEDSRKEAEETSVEDSELLSRILQDPGIGEDR